MAKIVEPKAIAMQFQNCINNADIDGLSELMTENHVFIDMENNRIEGKVDNLYKAWKPFFEMFPDYRNIIESVIVKNHTVIMQGYSICSDERLNNLRAIWIAEIVDNKVGLWQIFPDNKENKSLLTNVR